MLRKGRFLLCIIVILVCIFIFNTAASFAQEPLKKPLRKACRGFLNLLFGWIELIETPPEVGRQEGVPAGATYGLVKGIMFAAGRTLVGAYELVTFPIPIPSHYAPILKEPEFYPGEGKGLK
jgi:putative exosortase-associated protein (TIGR04073 family)